MDRKDIIYQKTANAGDAGMVQPQRELAEFNRYWRCLDDIYHDLARKMGLSDSAFIILYSLHTLGDGRSQRDICREASISKQTVHSSIRNLESRLEQLKAENDALETRINTDIDLNYIYKVATEELGMVYANRDQVLLYDRTESEYVRQYEDIPEH